MTSRLYLTGVNQESEEGKVGDELGVPAQRSPDIKENSRDLLPTMRASL